MRNKISILSEIEVSLSETLMFDAAPTFVQTRNSKNHNTKFFSQLFKLISMSMSKRKLSQKAWLLKYIGIGLFNKYFLVKFL